MPLLGTFGSASYLGFYGGGLSTLIKIGTNTWQYIIPVTSVLEIEINPLTSQLPTTTSFFLNYTIKKSSGNQNITVSCRRNASSGKISQSAFSLLGNSFAYSASAVSINNRSVDDHDSLAMLPDGTGVIATSNTNYLTAPTWDRFRGTSVLNSAVATNTVFPDSPTSFITTAQYGTMVSFPKTNSVCYINFSTSLLKINDGTAIAFPSAMTTYTSSVASYNNIAIISDGVNGFRIFKTGQSYAVDVFVDLVNKTVISATAVPFSYSFYNATEEDNFLGDLLYAVDGCISYCMNTNFYYGLGSNTSAVGWRDITAYNGDSLNSATAGTLDTQTGMDIFGSIETDGYVYFADWGHDNGGLFNFGNDNYLGVRKTNIMHITDGYIG